MMRNTFNEKFCWLHLGSVSLPCDEICVSRLVVASVICMAVNSAEYILRLQRRIRIE